MYVANPTSPGPKGAYHVVGLSKSITSDIFPNCNGNSFVRTLCKHGIHVCRDFFIVLHGDLTNQINPFQGGARLPKQLHPGHAGADAEPAPLRLQRRLPARAARRRHQQPQGRTSHIRRPQNFHIPPLLANTHPDLNCFLRPPTSI